MTTISTRLVAALQYHQAGNLAAAENLYREILQDVPNQYEALHLLGLVYFSSGRKNDGIGLIRQALVIKPNFAEAHYNLAKALQEEGLLEESIAGYQQAIRLKSDYADALYNLANLQRDRGEIELAIDAYRQAILAKSGFWKALVNLGNLFSAQGNFDEAIPCFEQVVSLQPNTTLSQMNLACALLKAKRFAEAVARYEVALRLEPQSPVLRNDFCAALNSWGNALLENEKAEEAVEKYREALRLLPEFAETYANLGNALRELKQLAKAEESHRAALRLKPNLVEAHSNLGDVLRDQGRYDEAIESYRRALQLDPEFTETYTLLGNALRDQQRLDEAMEAYDEAIRRSPENANAHAARGMTMMLRGEFENAWAEYEWRRRCKDFYQPKFRQPQWDGSKLEGRSILVHAEQGLGDTLQFVRYVSLVKDLGAKVLFHTQKPLSPLLKSFRAIDRLLIELTPQDAFDVHMPLLSLPGIFKTTLSNIPSPGPYLFADKALLERWHNELENDFAFKIGIAWQGNPKFKEDRVRSFRLKCFEPIAQLQGIRLFSLQKGFGSEQLQELGDRFHVTDLGSRLDNESGAFMDTAAVMKNLDLVITSDTAMAHLAGALGVPVWVALPFVPDWRWLLHRQDSPWYPTMRLYRQPSPGDWQSVFEQMKTDLSQMIS